MLTVRIIASRCAVFCQDIVGKRHVSRQVFEREMYAFTGILERKVLRSGSVRIQKRCSEAYGRSKSRSLAIIQMPYRKLRS